MSGAESLDEFADQFTRQVRSGHVPSPDEILEEFPEMSEDLIGFVKTLSILEETGFQHRTRGASPMVADGSGQRWTRVGGFRLIREISRGGMGIVYEAEQEALQRRVAIKVLPSNPLRTEIQLARFKREGTAIARLHHSHIVPVFGTGEQNGEPEWGHVVLRDLKIASSARASILASASRNEEAETALRESVNYAMKLEKTLAMAK